MEVVDVEGGVSFAAMKIPWVASVACWRKTVGECVVVVVFVVLFVSVEFCCCCRFDGSGGMGRWRTSMGMLSL